MSKRSLGWVAIVVATLVVAWIGTAIVLVFRPDPQFTGQPIPSTPGRASTQETRAFPK